MCVYVCSMKLSSILEQVMLNKHKQFGRLNMHDRAVTFQNINQIINTDLHNYSSPSLAMQYLLLVGTSQFFKPHCMVRAGIISAILFLKFYFKALYFNPSYPYA